MFRGSHLAVAVAGVLTLLTAGLTSPAAATTLDCDTFVHPDDDYLGIASCTNPTDHPWRFRAVVTCGWTPDATGAWVSLPPGGLGRSKGVCGRLGTGVGAVGVDERRL